MHGLRDKIASKVLRSVKRRVETSQNSVIVKKSSPKNLSANCRPFVGHLSADSWPTGFPQNTDYQLAGSRPTDDRQSAYSW